MRVILLTSFAVILGGCSSAEPYLVNGKYYVMGDKNCARYKLIYDGRIMCYNKNDEQIGYRDAMTDQELQMYMYEQQKIRQSIQSSKPKYTNCYNTYMGVSCTTY